MLDRGFYSAANLEALARSGHRFLLPLPLTSKLSRELLILHSLLDKAMREQGVYKQYSIAGVLAELKKLWRIEMSTGRTWLTEITKKQRTFFEKLNIPLPKTP